MRKSSELRQRRFVQDEPAGYIHALRYASLTRFYDCVVAVTTRERAFKNDLMRMADISDGDRVLDLGCGTGTLAVRLKRRVPGALVTALDGDPTALEVARRKADRVGVAISFDLGLASRLPYESGHFDKVLSSLLFHHLTTRDKSRALQEVVRVLRPGGQLHVADWGKPTGPVMRTLFYAVQLLDGFTTTADNVRGDLPALFRAAGLVDVAVRRELSTPCGTLTMYSAATPSGGSATGNPFVHM